MTMKLKLDIQRSAGENADLIFQRAKKLERKAEAAKDAIEELKKRIEDFEREELKEEPETVLKKRKWFEKFRWFRTSQGNLAIGGRDATTNEMAIKKHTTPDHFVLHADISGSPFFVLPPEATEKELMEAAIATVSYSRAWKKRIGEMEAYYVKASQVTKEAKAGEYMGKGAFMIYGEREYLTAPLQVAIGFTDRVIGGPLSAISAQTEKFVVIRPGYEKPSQVAKKIRGFLKIKASIDEIIRFLPPGPCDIERRK